jgi:hypothetical protein
LRFIRKLRSLVPMKFKIEGIPKILKLNPFAKELIKWRGKRAQKEVGDLADWQLKTYQGWEQGRQPSRFRINQIRRVMAENPEIHPH